MSNKYHLYTVFLHLINCVGSGLVFDLETYQKNPQSHGRWGYWGREDTLPCQSYYTLPQLWGTAKLQKSFSE